MSDLSDDDYLVSIPKRTRTRKYVESDNSNDTTLTTLSGNEYKESTFPSSDRSKMSKKKNKRKEDNNDQGFVSLLDESSENDDISPDRDENRFQFQRKRRREQRKKTTDRKKQMLLLAKRRTERLCRAKNIGAENQPYRNEDDETENEDLSYRFRKPGRNQTITSDDESEKSHCGKRIESDGDETYPSTSAFECELIDAEEPIDPANKLVLDYDLETNEELVTVNEKLVSKLKPHQREGVEFMWNRCFQSIERLKNSRGNGCILAHCMGLGKTLQVITLIHTLLTHRNTGVKTVLVVCPVGTILNWKAEFEEWLKNINDRKIKIHDFAKSQRNEARLKNLETWIKEGGVMIIGYSMFRTILTNEKMGRNLRRRIRRTLLRPGCDVVICDEGHVLKNEKSALSKTMNEIYTRRRILLTGTPLQNNLMECYCMVNFVKPGYLGTKEDFQNHYAHPITMGQYSDSSAHDVSVMKQKTYSLNKLLSKIIQRKNHEILEKYLPPKYEFVVITGLSDIQATLYQYYLEKYSWLASCGEKETVKLLADYQKMCLIWTHPRALKYGLERRQQLMQKRASNTRRSSITDEEDWEMSDLEWDRSDFSDSDNSIVGSSSEVTVPVLNSGRKKRAFKRVITARKRQKVYSSSSDDEIGVLEPGRHRTLLLSSDDENIEENLNRLHASSDVSIPDGDDTQMSRTDTRTVMRHQQVYSSSSDDEIGALEPDRRRRTRVLSSDDETIEENLNLLHDSSGVSSGVSIPDSDDTQMSRIDSTYHGSTYSPSEFSKNTMSTKRVTELSMNITDSEAFNNMNIEEENKPWWYHLVSDVDLEDHKIGPKVVVLLTLLKECEKIGDKILVFSQSLPSLDLIEYFLRKSDEYSETLSQHAGCSTDLVSSTGTWSTGEDYFRMDGKTSKEDRARYCNRFNDPRNKRARLFLISTKTGGLGINLTGANRVVVFDASWNPSNDIQSVFRAFRIGQKKPCYIYRLVSQATMEEIIYRRQVTKLGIAHRVIDEEQIDRHFTRENVGDLYAFERNGATCDDLTTKSTNDIVMTSVLQNHRELIVNLHNQDSFFKINEMEALTEEERKKADDDLNRSKFGEIDKERIASNIKHKIRSTLEQILDVSVHDNDLNALYEKLLQYYSNEKKKEKARDGTSEQKSPKKPIPTDPTDEYFEQNDPNVSYFDMHRPIFGMGIGRTRNVVIDPESLVMKQQALLHGLRTQPSVDAFFSSSDDPLNTPSTWKLICPGKDPAELETIFKTAFPWDRKCLPAFSHVGSYLLVHLNFCPRRRTLEEKLLGHNIQSNPVFPDFDTVESLLGSYFCQVGKEDALSDESDNDGDDVDDDVDDESDYDDDDDAERFAEECENRYGGGYDTEYASEDDGSLPDYSRDNEI